MVGSIVAGTPFLLSAVLAAQPAPEQEPAEQSAETTTIVVTGTRIQTPNRKSASPVQTVRTEDFVMTGVPNVEQTLNQLPQIVPSFTNTSNNPGTGAATLDLRGLGSVRTLILVNGRRWIANDAGQTPEIDVNTIPAALINRVDIVTGGASAVYGSDAVTGVINFVLKNKLEGLHLEARNNITERGDGRVSSADLSYGTSFLKGRGNLLASIGWLNQEPVLQAARAYSAFALGDGCAIKGTETKFGFSTPSPNLDGLCDDPDEEFGFIPGGSSFIPAGFIGGGNPGILFPGTGTTLIRRPQTRFTEDGSLTRFNFATDAYNFAAPNYMQVPLRRISGNLIGSLEVSDHFEPYTELSYIRTRSPQQLAPAAGSLGSGVGTVARVRFNLDNPFLSPQARAILDTSFGVDAQGDRGFLGSNTSGFTTNPAFDGDADGIVTLSGQFRTRLTGLGPRQIHSQRKAYRVLAGARGKLAGSFDYDLYFSASKVKHNNPLVNSGSASRLQQAILARRDSSGNVTCIDPTDGCVPVDIFGGQDVSPEAAEFIRANPLEQTTIKEQVAEASVKGIVAELPAGSLRTAFGVHWRKTSFAYEPDRTLEQNDNLGFNPSTGSAGKTKVIELFGEALVPILSQRRFAEELSAELGLRYSHYDTVGGVWTWKAMGYWSPIRQLRFRGGLQQAIRAPNVRELFEEESILSGFVTDPCAPELNLVADPAIAAACIRNGAVDLPPAGVDFFPLFRVGGSTDLSAEKARTLTLGFVAQPLTNLSLTVDYYDINIRGAVGVFGGGAAFTVFGCIAGGGDPADPLCQAYQREGGEITFINQQAANLTRMRTRGIDWQLSYRFPLLSGEFRLNLSGTRLLSAELQSNDNLNPIQCDGYFLSVCGSGFIGGTNPRWKLFNRFGWQKGPMTLSLRHRYFSATRASLFAINEALGLPPPDFIPERGHWLESRHYFDAAVAAEINDRFQITLGVNNLANTSPSLLSFGAGQANTEPSLYDVLGRRFFVALNAKIF